MKNVADILKTHGRVTVAGAPEGIDARVLAELADGDGREVLHVARDDARMAALAETLSFFAPGLEVLTFPAWDCVPYDRVSPGSEVVSRRLDTLTRLAEPTGARGGRVILTTVNALLQRVPPRELFAGSVLRVKVGEALPLEDLARYLERNGYFRAETVREPGEYAIRGGIVDLFPPGSGDPLRVDLFGDVLDGVRSFDPVSQLSSGRLDRIELKPVSEVFLDDEAITRFRAGYRELFGAVGDSDPLYEAISAGRRYTGMEHWLPLFHERLETLLDYVPDAALTLDPQAEDARDARLEMIADYYEARQQMATSAGLDGSLYRPLPPDRLYLDEGEWNRLLGRRPVGVFSPFATPTPTADTVDVGGRPGRDFADARARPDVNVFDALGARIGEEQTAGRRVVVAAYSPGSRDRLAGLLRDHGVARVRDVASWSEAAALPRETVALAVLGLERGFVGPDLAVITEQDALGDRLARPSRPRRRRAEAFISEASALGEGDLVVHVDHGIGRYDGLATLEVGGAPHDCLRIIYEGGDKLFVPVENIEVLSRYGSEEAGAQLDRLGGAAWQARKARVKKRIRDIADQLIKVAAERQLKHAPVMTPPSGLYDEFCARFPYPETEDQIRSIDTVLEDLGSGRPMDRLVCGDVGFGKTEVALRAAFVAVMAGWQVAVIVPTTLLARQHFRTFRERFAGYPVRVEQLSRLVAPRRAAEIRRGLADGKVDIVIGTHALLAKDMTMQRLGLLVVDEEQHFGVTQKERLKRLRTDVHVLTLTATPIPRTLQLALSGVREMSLIATPPVDRLAVRTFVLPFDPVIVREAILRERYRGGQTFYVCPRIEDIPRVEERLRKLVPEVKMVTAHGRMAAGSLERVMAAFYDGRYDVLLSTNIVESGLDIPTANTMIIHRSDMFGLAQLYQLRGRIGRSKLRAYAYLTMPPGRALTQTAQRRLEVLQTLDSLGAGFTLASHDLDIRGAGNLLGEEQSGHIREVGIELYQNMLEEAVAAARVAEGEAAPEAAETWTPQITIGTPVRIPEDYIADLGVRLGLYRRIAHLVDRGDIEAFAAEIIDRFGPLPAEVENLLAVVAIKQLCREAGVEKVDAGPKGAVLAFRNDAFANPAGLVDFIAHEAGTVKLRPDHRLVYRRDWRDPRARITGIRHLMERLAQVAGAAEPARPRVAAHSA